MHQAFPKSSWNAGAGLRPAHYPALEGQDPLHIQWFEVISENYMDSYGRPREVLRALRERFPIAMHGVSLNLASASRDPSDRYLSRLKALVCEVDPFIVSDHLCWTATEGGHWHDLLPFPLTIESRDLVLGRLHKAQDALQRPIYIENISAYARFVEQDFHEIEFLTEVARRAGTKLLLDINNVYVNAQNFGFDAAAYLEQIPVELIGQIHLAGHTDCGDYLFDTHAEPVGDEVWQLFSLMIQKCPEVPFMIERDDQIPSFEELDAEVGLAIRWADASGGGCDEQT